MIRKKIFILLLSFITIFAFSCEDKETSSEPFTYLVKEVKVLNAETRQITIDNFAHSVFIEFGDEVDISNVEIQIKLAEGVSMVTPANSRAIFDFSRETQSFRVKKGNTEITYRFKIKFKFNPTLKGWQKTDMWGVLPEYLSVYKYTNSINNKNVKAYIAVTDMNNTTPQFTILGKAKYEGSKPTPSQFYTNYNYPKVVMNGGYFSGNSSVGLILSKGKLVNPQQTTISRTYNGTTVNYYPTRGAFGWNRDGTFSAHWCYTPDAKTIYCYEKPSPNGIGKAPQPIPSATFPTKATVWTPTEAIGAGPVLIKDGEYKNSWEAEMFDEASGVGPTYNNPRSAIGYTPSGYLIFFVCEGRNKTESIPGLTLQEVANILLEIGCSEAINLDGGGSSCLLINGKETIKPSDGNQRAITTAVAVY
jgi:exopolysaccharide biosynthesis protein